MDGPTSSVSLRVFSKTADDGVDGLLENSLGLEIVETGVTFDIGVTAVTVINRRRRRRRRRGGTGGGSRSRQRAGGSRNGRAVHLTFDLSAGRQLMGGGASGVLHPRTHF